MATIGKVEVLPGGANVVPGKCIFTVEVRDPSSSVIKALSEGVIQALTNHCEHLNLDLTFRVMSDIAAVGRFFIKI